MAQADHVVPARKKIRKGATRLEVWPTCLPCIGHAQYPVPNYSSAGESRILRHMHDGPPLSLTPSSSLPGHWGSEAGRFWYGGALLGIRGVLREAVFPACL